MNPFSQQKILLGIQKRIEIMDQRDEFFTMFLQRFTIIIAEVDGHFLLQGQRIVCKHLSCNVNEVVLISFALTESSGVGNKHLPGFQEHYGIVVKFSAYAMPCRIERRT